MKKFVQRALLNIGFSEAKRIILCLVFMENMLRKLRLKQESLYAFWKHSVYVACAARILSEKTLMEDPQKAYTAGLLHDIGKLILYMCVENYDSIISDAHSKGISITDTEKENFGIDHQELGYIISIKWKFPEELSYIIRHHHNYCTDSGKYRLLSKSVGIADCFSVSPDASDDPENFILLQEKNSINEELNNIMYFLKVGEYEKR